MYVLQLYVLHFPYLVALLAYANGFDTRAPRRALWAECTGSAKCSALTTRNASRMYTYVFIGLYTYKKTSCALNEVTRRLDSFHLHTYTIKNAVKRHVQNEYGWCALNRFFVCVYVYLDRECCAFYTVLIWLLGHLALCVVASKLFQEKRRPICANLDNILRLSPQEHNIAVNQGRSASQQEVIGCAHLLWPIIAKYIIIYNLNIFAEYIFCVTFRKVTYYAMSKSIEDDVVKCMFGAYARAHNIWSANK